MTITELLQEQKRLTEAATEGWHTFETSWDRNALGVENDADELVFWEAGGGITVAYPHDAEFIAAARSSVPKLLAAVEAVMAVLSSEEAWLDHQEELGQGKQRRAIGIGRVRAAVEAALGGEGE